MRNSPLGRKIRGDPRTRRDMRMQTHQVRMVFSKTRHRFRERINEPRHELKCGKIRVSESRIDQKSRTARISLQHVLEVAKIFWQPLPDQIVRAPFGLALLFLVIEARRDWVMAVVRFPDEIGDRELNLMRPQSSCRCRRRQTMPLAEEQKDV